jgi:hypothetical protein
MRSTLQGSALETAAMGSVSSAVRRAIIGMSRLSIASLGGGERIGGPVTRHGVMRGFGSKHWRGGSFNGHQQVVAQEE